MPQMRAIRESCPAVIDLPPGREGVAVTQYARSVLFNGLGRYEEAFEAATAADLPDAEGLAMSSTVMAESVEAAARIGRLEQAVRALQEIAEMAHASGTDWIVGMEARSRALVIDGDDAEPLYKQAIERLDRTLVRGNSPGLICSTESGCGARTVGLMHASNSDQPTRC